MPFYVKIPRADIDFSLFEESVSARPSQMSYCSGGEMFLLEYTALPALPGTAVVLSESEAKDFSQNCVSMSVIAAPTEEQLSIVPDDPAWDTPESLASELEQELQEEFNDLIGV